MNANKMTPIAIIVACLALAGCASTGAATPTATQPPQPAIIEAAAVAPTETPQPTATSAAISTPRPTSAPAQPTQTDPPTPENTSIPTATSYPDPAVPLSPTGPWLVFRDNGGMQGIWDSGYLWAINQDGTGLTRLTNEPVCAFAVRPGSSIQNGLTIAYTASGYCEQGGIWGSPTKLLSWPGGDVKTIVYNLSYGAEELKWSPSGSKLAFTGAMGDTSPNVFVYDAATEQSTRVAVTDDDDFRLLWSTDERYVIFQSFYQHVMSGGPVVTGMWSARADASGVTRLVGEIEDQYVRDIEYLGRVSPTEFIVTFDQEKWVGENWTSNRDIRILNIETGSYTTLVSEPLLDVAYSPEHDLYLMTKDVAPAPSRLLIFYQNGERREVAGYTIKYVEWLSAYDVFLGQTPDGRAYLISPDGTVTEIPSPEWNVASDHRVIVSPDGQWWAWHHSDDWHWDTRASELWVGPAMTQPSTLLSFAPFPSAANFRVYWGYVIWSPDSQYLLWASKAGIFAASPPNFEATLVTRFSKAAFLNAVWVH